MFYEYFQVFFKDKVFLDFKCVGYGDLVYFYKDFYIQVFSLF